MMILIIGIFIGAASAFLVESDHYAAVRRWVLSAAAGAAGWLEYTGWLS